MIKRLIDITISLLFLPTVYPLAYIVLGLLIKLDSRGPVIFRQKRTGFHGRTFTCYKFRTMHTNDHADTHQAIDNDPRITRVGKTLRLLHLDELPQFCNVLRGDMSIVGPRPHMLCQTQDYSRRIEGYAGRHAVRPGITGLAQVNGYCGTVKSEADIRGRVRLDLWYASHRTAGLDCYIFLSTLVNKIRKMRKLRKLILSIK